MTHTPSAASSADAPAGRPSLGRSGRLPPLASQAELDDDYMGPRSGWGAPFVVFGGLAVIGLLIWWAV